MVQIYKLRLLFNLSPEKLIKNIEETELRFISGNQDALSTSTSVKIKVGKDRPRGSAHVPFTIRAFRVGPPRTTDKREGGEEGNLKKMYMHKIRSSEKLKYNRRK